MLIVLVDLNIFLCRNLCTKKCWFVEQHRHTFHSHKQYIQCLKWHFDNIQRGNFRTWLIQPNRQENHQICRRHKVCCLRKTRKRQQKGTNQWCWSSKKSITKNCQCNAYQYAWLVSSLYLPKVQSMLWVKNGRGREKSVDIPVYKTKEHDSEGSLTTAQNQYLLQICSRRI